MLIVLASAVGLPRDLNSVPASMTETVMHAFRIPLAVNAATMASIYGSFRFTIDYRDGYIARQLLWQSRNTSLIAKMPPTMAAGAAIGAISCLIFAAVVGAAMRRPVLDFETLGQAAVLGIACSLWGLCVGSLVRAHLVALFIVPATLVLALPLALWKPEVSGWSPLSALLQSTGNRIPGELPLQLAGALGLAWLALAIIASLWAFNRRDIC
ncbi:hypothetical protein [Arthrobacter sp. RAF14]|uniref:hypothetical protein n=1 Tax=Arthrobacter sp. RAF14 TaxID=3233051 RepID=UPI003F93E2BC